MATRRVIIYAHRGESLCDAADASSYCPYCQSSSGHKGGCSNFPEVVILEDLSPEERAKITALNPDTHSPEPVK